ncbi:hypothetical protein TNCV_1599501 [Trichonephila clavipes]|nr:hypothetical protein TNCV_1599501 [Trichonephila clavipes]
MKLATTVLLTSSHATPLTMWPVSPLPITPIGSTKSLSENGTELLDSVSQELTIDELIEIHGQENIEEL